ncbi:unnamed protein product [Orchesella dallaii]|uniref:Uncharacterized protein n=1 Tax=Orchesella dallaii TaxID=48710 RepID=A0ABP1Q4Y3_9HEXA
MEGTASILSFLTSPSFTISTGGGLGKDLQGICAGTPMSEMEEALLALTVENRKLLLYSC